MVLFKQSTTAEIPRDRSATWHPVSSRKRWWKTRRYPLLRRWIVYN